jgi:hypothetical protein
MVKVYSTLTEREHGMSAPSSFSWPLFADESSRFRWVVCQLDELRECESSEHDLNVGGEMYARILDEVREQSREVFS